MPQELCLLGKLASKQKELSTVAPLYLLEAAINPNFQASALDHHKTNHFHDQRVCNR